MVDSQSVASAPHKGGGATPRETKGYDPAQRVKGRKRFVGGGYARLDLRLGSVACVGARDARGQWVVVQACVASSRVRQVWADTAFKGAFEEAMAQAWGVEVVRVQRCSGRGVEVLLKRWIVERMGG